MSSSATASSRANGPARARARADVADTAGSKLAAAPPPGPEGAALAQITAGAALLCICVLAFSIRLFSVVKYESVIHEFDPYFNYRVTQYLTKEGYTNLWNWFDDRTWYPLGRVVGGTVYPVRSSSTLSPRPALS